MAEESEGIDIKLSEEDSPADILRESEDISLFADDHDTGEASASVSDSIPDDEYQETLNKAKALMAAAKDSYKYNQ